MSVQTHMVKERFLDNLKDYCTFAEKNDYMTVTDWHNGEGFTIEVSSKGMGTRVVQMTYGEIEALNVLLNYRGE